MNELFLQKLQESLKSLQASYLNLSEQMTLMNNALQEVKGKLNETSIESTKKKVG